MDRLCFELPFEVFSNFSVFLGLLRDDRLFLTFLILFLLILQLTFSLVQISQVPLTYLQSLLVVVGLIGVKSFRQQFSDGMLIPDDPLSGLSDLFEDFLFEGIESQEPSEVINFSTVDDDDRVAWLILLVYGHFRDLLDDFHSVDHLPEDHMFAIEMRAGLERDEELGGVGVPTAVGHRK